MWMLFLAAMFSTSKSEIPPDLWRCANDVEVWCDAEEGCAARPAGETTPMAISAASNGALSVCAYTGCWEGKAAVTALGGRLLWAADGLAFSTKPEGGFEADVTLLIDRKDGIGFVRAGGIASPVRCLPEPVDRAAQ